MAGALGEASAQAMVLKLGDTGSGICPVCGKLLYPAAHVVRVDGMNCHPECVTTELPAQPQPTEVGEGAAPAPT